ncbi:hypothetical protein [Planococcus salinus]|uniref:YtzI protein n=1 Tax=Planococcus salinus TaxID=1848460 RepID=A0A3M8P427_9BACL|nr:hypothetical protein [Planococcus salinus]RNF38417.1 hypothetical protein EEX84_14430 [Planococcus salinus]
MLYGVTVVLGFMVVIGLFFAVLMHFLGKGLNTHDAEIIDPTPEVAFDKAHDKKGVDDKQ